MQIVAMKRFLCMIVFIGVANVTSLTIAIVSCPPEITCPIPTALHILPSVGLNFNGLSSYVTIPDSVKFSAAPSGLTVMAWISPSTYKFAHYVHPLAKGDASGAYEWAFRIYNESHPKKPGRISFYAFNLQGGEGCGSYFEDKRLTPNEWIHVTGVIDMQLQMTWIYKNGIQVGNHALSGRDTLGNRIKITPQHGPGPVRAGSRDGTRQFFQGAIAEVWIWNRPLSPSEIYHAYQLGALLRTNPPPGPAAGYTFSEGKGLKVNDETRQHHAGEIQEAVWSTAHLPPNETASHGGGGC